MLALCAKVSYPSEQKDNNAKHVSDNKNACTCTVTKQGKKKFLCLLPIRYILLCRHT